MALRIRRGTDADRQTITFAEGELVYTTDTKELYIGDGITAGGILVSQTEDTPIGGIASIVEDITPQLGGNLDLNNLEINGFGNINISGTVTADVISGSLFVGDGSGLTNLPIINNGDEIVDGSNYRINIVGEDSTIIVDSFSNTVTGNFVGDGSQITNLPSISVFDLSNVFAFTPPDLGDVLQFDGANFVSQKITRIEGADSSIMLDTFSNTFTGNFVGNLVGDIQGSIFGDDSTLLVDSSNGTLNGRVVGEIVTRQNIVVNLNKSISDDNNGIEFNMFRGTIESPLEPDNFDRAHIFWNSYDPLSSTYQVDVLVSGYHQAGGGGYIALSAADDSYTLFNTAIELDGKLGTISLIGTTSVTGSLILDFTQSISTIPTPVAGQFIYNNDSELISFYDGFGWFTLSKTDEQGTTDFAGPIIIGATTSLEREEFGADSTAVSGAILYNSTVDRFQFFQAGSWVNLINNGGSIGQLLAWNGTEWSAVDPEITVGTIENASTLNGFNGSYYLDYNNFVNTPVIPTVLTDLGIVDGTVGQVLTTNGTGVFSFQTVSSATALTDLTDVSTAGLTIDEIYLSAVTTLSVTNLQTTAYLFDQYGGNNPTIYTINGTTIAFDLNIVGHPFLIQDGTGTNFNIGLIHVAENGTVSVGAAAQGQTAGTLYWKIPGNISGNYQYRCSIHGTMLGVIAIAEAVKIGGESLRSRDSITGSTGSISDGASANVNITGYKGYMLYKVQTSAAAWVRLYVSAAARTADASRTQGQDPLPGSGVIAEVITTGAETVIIAPGVIGFNNELPVTNVIPMAVTNLSGGIADIVITLTAVEMEV